MTPSDSMEPKIRRSVQTARNYLLRRTGTELYRFELSIGSNAKFCNFWMVLF